MALKKYLGSCRCKKVRFEVWIDLTQGTFKCNCTSCVKARFWGASALPENFKYLEGESEVSVYSTRIDGMFCKHCGVGIGGGGDIPEAGGKFIAINLGALDNLDPKEWASVPVSYLDGLHDRWDREPEFISHL
ncbi:GFA family protein [Leptospira johnsonii]|uniref:Glutathione-dependent formaldehyde-activating n=1 Tax=Leptospira johnsonii TaxID=1917820 RepID=A0A2P2D223_9LEPT|nr:GFA family protein [Leptospira johnsonii]GBF38521.1 glutathione-dependent formaldehyde-activating [Leptospira johnsonii]